jgi:hypothetical protein
MDFGAIWYRGAMNLMKLVHNVKDLIKIHNFYLVLYGVYLIKNEEK